MRVGLCSLVVAAGFAATSAFAQETIEPPVTPQPAAPAHVVVPVPGDDQQLPIMTIDRERLFLGSAWGRRAQADLDARLKALSDENDRLVAGFANEEQELTQLRQTLPAEEFRARAAEFDKRVVEVRRERDAKGRELQQTADNERATFLQATLPILAQLMREKGAVVVLDQSMIFVSADSIDMTTDLIARVDQEVGEGPVAKNLSAPANQNDQVAPGPVTPAPTAPEPDAPQPSAPDAGAPIPDAPPPVSPPAN